MNSTSILRFGLCLTLITVSGLLFSQNTSTSATKYEIRINGYVFDPLQSMPDLDTRLKITTPPPDSFYQLIQFSHSPTRQETEQLRREHGLKLNQFFPNYTYLERVTLGQLEKIRSLSLYRWHGNYEPAYKISPTIGTLKFRTPERQKMANLLIWAICHPHADAAILQKRLTRDGATEIVVIDERKLKGSLKFQFQIPNRNALDGIAMWDEIKRIEEVSETFDDNGNTAGTIQSGTPGTTPIWNVGIHGEGQIIGILDGGRVDIDHCMFDDATEAVGNTHRKVVGHRGTAAESDHATFVAGIACGNDLNNPGTGANRGMAWAAKFTDEGRNSANILSDLTEAHADGAFIHTNSWHDEPDPQYNQVAQDVDQYLYANELDFVCGSSGNVGESIGPPGTAKNALCVSATQFDPNENNFGDGNNGPTPEGRRKPEIFAPGCTITSAQVNTNCTITTDAVVFGFGPICATSWATPAIAGTAALVRQYFTEGWYPNGVKNVEYAFAPSGALIKAVLLNSTMNMTGIAGYPGDQEGWGLVRLNDVLFLPGNARNLWVWDVLNGNGLFTGEQQSYVVNVQNAATPLKITLAWTEPPAESGSATPWVNDLTLTVTAPNGDVFTGNDFNAGQSTVNGVTADGVNNVEIVLVNTPQVGQYVIQVSGTAINEGPQGFALVATADTEDPPTSTGDQNTLVVRVTIPGTVPSGAPSLTTATNLMTTLNTYINEVSYGLTTITPDFVEATLTSPLGDYAGADDNFLIEMTQDVVTQLITTNANVFTRGTVAPGDDIDRIVILLNDNSFTGDWATTGPWPYELPAGLTRRLSVSVSSVFNDPDRRLAHAMCHQLGMLDLYNHPGVAFAQPHVDNWDIMANQSDCQPMAWSKSKALWLRNTVPGNILWIPRPAAGSDFNQEVALNFLSANNNTAVRAIVIGLTPGVVALEDENVFFVVEARSNAAGTADAILPESGVLLYYVNENIQQGEGPARVIDQLVGTTTLDDAALESVGQDHNLTGTYGLRVSRIMPAGTENTRVRIEYNPIESDNDVNIRTGDPVWVSPDIWVDSQEDGYASPAADQDNDPIADEENRIYFTIHNPGPGVAFDVTVSVRVSEPYHTLGEAADFNRFVAQKFYPSLGVGDLTDFVLWEPADLPNNHTCISVEIHDVFNDINDYNNKAQENVRVAESRTSSPYETITHYFSVTNPYDYHQLFYFRAEGVPPDWSAGFAESKKLLSAHEHYEGSYSVTPPDGAPVCTDHKIYLTSWMPKGNTLVPYGGGTLQVNLRSLTTLTSNTTMTSCQRTRDNKTKSSAVNPSYAKCIELVTEGCTNPIRANEEVIIRYEDPQGNPVYRVVMTDAMGCYSDTYVVAEGGEWTVTATIKGTECQSGSSTPEVSVVVPLPPGGRPGDGTTGEFQRGVWFSAHVGSTFPLGPLNKTSDANICAFGDLTVPIRNRINLQLLFGINQLTAETSTGIEHPRWVNLSANAQLILARSFQMKPYVRGGPGYYRDKNNINSMGFNIGVGGMKQIDKELFITPGIDWHYIPAGKNEEAYFLAAHIGLIFK